jgi:hypothetical protein
VGILDAGRTPEGPTSPSQRFAPGPSLSPLKGGEGLVSTIIERQSKCVHTLA